MRSLRRLKNVIAVFEWTPNLSEPVPKAVSSLFTSKASLPMEFDQAQEQLLLRCFTLMDVDEDGKLTEEDLERVRVPVCFKCCVFILWVVSGFENFWFGLRYGGRSDDNE
jgi:hypothetical protein